MATTLPRSDEATTPFVSSREPWNLIRSLLANNAYLGTMLYFNRRYDEAIEQERKTLELDPAFGPAHEFLRKAYLQTRNYREAIAEFEKAPAHLGGGPGPTVLSAWVHAASGRKADALQVMDRLKTAPQQGFGLPRNAATVYALLGLKDEAFAELENAFAGRSLLPNFVRLEPTLDPLRSDVRWADLMRRLGLEL